MFWFPCASQDLLLQQSVQNDFPNRSGNISVPTLSGTVKVANTLTITPGTWDGSPALTYQWYRSDDTGGTNEEPIDIAKFTTYQPCFDDFGKYLRVKETANGGPSVYSAYTSIVTRQTVVEDLFNKRGAINTSEWTVTNPSDNIAISQTNGYLNFSDNTGNTTINLRVNELRSIKTITTGVIVAKLRQLVNTNVTSIFSMQFGAGGNTNEIQVVRNSTSGTAAILVVRVSGVATYTFTTAIAWNNTWKIHYNSSAQTVKFYYWDAATGWAQAGTTQTSVNYSGATAQGVLSMSAVNSGVSQCAFDSFIMANEDFNNFFADRFIPPTSSTPQTAWFASCKLGWFFHLPPFKAYSVGDTRRRMTFNYDFATIAGQAQTAGNVQYASIHAKDELGFRWFNYTPDYNNGSTHTYNSITTPQYGFDHHIGNSTLSGMGITDDHIQRFLNEFNSRGIKAGIYYSLGQDNNYRNTVDGAGGVGLHEYFGDYMDLVYSEIDYLLDNNTGINYIWFDWVKDWWPIVDGFGDSEINRHLAGLYQRIKRKRSDCLIVFNVLNTYYSSSSLFPAPTDVVSSEYDFKPSNAEIEDLTRNWGGTDYYIPGEIVQSLISGSAGRQWPWLDPTYEAPGTYNSVDSQVNFQAIYDFAKARGVPFGLNIPVKQDGTIDSTYYTRAAGIVP